MLYFFLPFYKIFLFLNIRFNLQSAQLVATNMVTFLEPKDLLLNPLGRAQRDQILMTSLVENNLDMTSLFTCLTFITHFVKIEISVWKILRIFVCAFLSVLLTTGILSTIVP